MKRTKAIKTKASMAKKRRSSPFKAIPVGFSILASILIFMAFFVLPSVSHAVDCALTPFTHGHTTRYAIAWTSDGAGAYACTTTIPLLGRIDQFITDPSADALAPDAAYDISLSGAATGIDLDGGSLDNRSATATEAALPVLGELWIFEKVTVAVSAAGAANGGVIYIDVERP